MRRIFAMDDGENTSLPSTMRHNSSKICSSWLPNTGTMSLPQDSIKYCRSSSNVGDNL